MKGLKYILTGLFAFGLYLKCDAATFSGTASISANDSSGALSADSVNNTLTASCWFRLSIPSSANLTENLVILMDRTDGNEGANFSYEVRFNIFTGNVEFLARGANGAITNTLIARPYLDRWYHVAVVRQQSAFTAYVDGRQLAVFPSTSIGSAVGGGLSIGGISGNSRLFLGDIVEVAIYQAALSQNLIQDRMFKDQRTFANLKGYYKLAYSTNASDFYHNFVPTPPSGTDPATKQGAGTIAFEETDQAGEQSLFDSRKNRGQDALTPLSGAFSWSQTAMARPVPGIGFNFQFGYSSAAPTTAPPDGSADPFEPRVLGKGWRHTFDVRIAPEQISTERRLILWDGSVETWNRTNSLYYTRHKEYRGELVQLPDFSFEWTTPERLVYHFQDPTDGSLMAGRLREIRDFNGNKVQIQWNEDEGFITNVIDTVGAMYAFNYNTALGLLTNLSFGAWQVNFAYDATNRLISKSITNTSGIYSGVNTAWQFAYNGTNGLLERISDPRGNTNFLVQYDQYGRQTNQVDALLRSTQTRFGVPGNRQITRFDPATNSWVETYDRKGHMLAQQDPLTNITTYAYDTNGNRISITEPLGWTTTFGYDSRANAIAKTNALGEITRWVMHSFFNKAIQQITPQPMDTNGAALWTNYFAYDGGGNLTNQSDGFGSLVQYTYATNGLVLASTDANGHTTRFAYDTNGFLIARTDPATNTTTFVANEVGWKLREINSLGDTISYTLDLNGNAVRMQDVIGRIFNRAYDANGNLLSSTDGKGMATTYAYDLANQKTNMTDRTGTNKYTYFYTSRGKLDRVTDPLSNSVTNLYDAANRLIRVTDPLGQSITNQFDVNGNLTVLFDKLGQRWSKTYDRLNRVIAEADPLGNTKNTTFDVAGRVQQITSPNGYPSVNTYDGRGRLIKWIDPMDFPWLYAYDGVANITNITDALGGHYVMAYGLRNERLSELNQDNKQWNYAYDELLRLKQQTDPNGTIRTPIYDPAGRVQTVNFSTGRQDSFSYDDNDNPKLIKRRASGVTTATQFVYDSLDRVTEQDDALSQTVRYGFDPLGRVTAITYPGNKTLTNCYDALGRLTNQTDWAGRQMNYVYDTADRLISRTYPNGVTQTNAFDTAGRLTSLSYSTLNPQPSTLNAALTYAYDRNGNKTGSGENGTFTWPLPSLTDETANFTPAGKLINRQISTSNAPLSTLTYSYDASGNVINATGNGQSWTLAYDEDNRTASIHWDSGLTAKDISNRYDAMGRRISKTTDGATTGYVLSLTGGMERILCDLNPEGTTNFYVHGPDLCYKVDATNGLACYHADAQGNIITLTGPGGTNLAQYAYTPYGRSLGSTNFQSQILNPYLFVGSQGVMEELPGLLFMRARYYCTDAGVFLSTDPVKKIGPGWKPEAYYYANRNPLTLVDAKGTYWELPLSSADFSGNATFAKWGKRATGSFTTGSDEFDSDIRSTEGAGAEIYASVPLVGYFPGAESDWENYTEYEFSGGFLGKFGVDIGHNSKGNWGVSVSVGVGFGLSVIKNKIQSDSDYHTKVNLSSTLTIGSAKNVPLITQTANIVGTGQPASSMVNAATVANGHATSANQFQVTQTAQSSGVAGTTPMFSSSTSSGGNRSGSTATSTQATTSSSTSFLGRVGGIISSVASSIGGFFGSIFGGGHR